MPRGPVASGELTIVLVEQYLALAMRLADSYVLMDAGEVVAGGPVGELDEAAAEQLLAV